MPHGDLSDFVGFTVLAMGIATLNWPAAVWTSELKVEGLVHVKPFFDVPTTSSLSTGAILALKVAGVLMIFLGWLFFGVRWNKVNARGSNAPGCLLVAGNLIYIAYKMDNEYADGVFVLRMWHLLAGVFMIGCLHMLFNANPVLNAKYFEDQKAAASKKKQ